MALQPEQSSMYLVCPGRPNPTPSMAPTSNSPEPSISKLANKNKKDKEPGPPQSQPSQAIMTEESMYDKLEFNAHGSAEDELKHQKLRAELTRFSSSDIQSPAYRAKLAEYQKALATRKNLEEAELRKMVGSRQRLAYALQMAVDRQVSLHREIDPTQVILGKLIGRGASGKVYSGTWRGQTVAVKHCGPDSPGFDLKEFYREVGLMSLLNHPNLMTCIGAASKNVSSLYLLTEMMPFNLADFLKSGEMNVMLSVSFAMDIAKGMAFLHSLGLIHRDLKTSNCLLTRDLNVKIIDFGLSRVVDVSKLMTANVGTTQYMAPELFENQKYSEKADVYSYAIVMWEIFTQREPFQDKPCWSIPSIVVKGERPAIPKFISPLLANLIKRCWDGNQNKRPSFEKIGDKLLKILHDDTTSSTLLKPVSGRWDLLRESLSRKSLNTDTTGGAVSAVFTQPDVIRFLVERTATYPFTSESVPFEIVNNVNNKTTYQIDKYTDDNVSLTFHKSSGTVKSHASTSVEAKLELKTPISTAIGIPIIVGKGACILEVLIHSDCVVFGVNPVLLRQAYDSDSASPVPEVLVLLKDCLKVNHGYSTANLFLTPGEASEMQKIKDLINCGQFSPTQIASPHDVASLIKTWFREIPFGIVDDIPVATMEQSEDYENMMQQYLKPDCRKLLRWIIVLIAGVVSFSTTKTTAHALAAEFAGSIFHGSVAAGSKSSIFSQRCVIMLERLVNLELGQK